MSPLCWATRRRPASASAPASVRPGLGATQREASNAMASDDRGAMRSMAARTDPGEGSLPACVHRCQVPGFASSNPRRRLQPGSANPWAPLPSGAAVRLVCTGLPWRPTDQPPLVRPPGERSLAKSAPPPCAPSDGCASGSDATPRRLPMHLCCCCWTPVCSARALKMRLWRGCGVGPLRGRALPLGIYRAGALDCFPLGPLAG